MNTRIMAVALVVLGLLSVRAVQAQPGTAQLIRVVPLAEFPLDTNFVSDNVTIIVIDPDVPPRSFPQGCTSIGGNTYQGVETIVIFHGVDAALRVTMYKFSGSLSRGNRIEQITSDASLCCPSPTSNSCSDPNATDNVRLVTGPIQQPASAGSALFSSPVELDSDAIGVVTGQPNDDGTYKVIFKKQGSPAQQVDISSDDVLLAADVLRDLIHLGCDPDTGEHLYLADIEW